MPAHLAEIAKTGTIQPLYDILFTSIISFVLLMSSLTMVLAASAIQRGDHRARALAAAHRPARRDRSSRARSTSSRSSTTRASASPRHPLGSAFYTLTGFHGVHVTVGIVMLVSPLVLSFRGKLHEDRAEAVEIVGLYWHFVDVVWVAHLHRRLPDPMRFTNG